MLKKNLIRFLLPLLLLFGTCQKKTEYYSLKVYIEDPALFYALSLYQQRQDSAPLSIHLRRGLDMFFQLSHSSGAATRLANSSQQESLNRNAMRLALGGGLFISSELTQLASPELHLDKLPNTLKPSLAIPLEITENPYMAPLLLYPTMFEVTTPIGSQGAQPLEGVARLLSQSWLEQQLLQNAPPPQKKQVYFKLQNPQQILENYLRSSPLQVRLNLPSLGIDLGAFNMNRQNVDPNARHKRGAEALPLELSQFIANYRDLLGGKKLEQQNQTERKLAEKLPQNSQKNPKGNTSSAERDRAGVEFIRLQQQLYQDTAKGYKIAYLGAKATIEPAAYPYIYFKGVLRHSSTAVPNLQLQLDKILWGAISEGLSQAHREQALNLLHWLQSREGQRALQQELPQLDRDNILGIFRALSIHREVNTQFWQNLQLDWPERFTIRWQLTAPLILWESELLHKASSEQKYLLRKHWAASVAKWFLLPYLFLPPPLLSKQKTDKQTTDSETASQPALQANAEYWSRWLPPL